MSQLRVPTTSYLVLQPQLHKNFLFTPGVLAKLLRRKKAEKRNANTCPDTVFIFIFSHSNCQIKSSSGFPRTAESITIIQDAESAWSFSVGPQDDNDFVQQPQSPVPLAVCLHADEGDNESFCHSPLLYTEPGTEPICLSPLISSPISISIDAPSDAIFADLDWFEKLIAISDGDQDVLQNINLAKPFPNLPSKLTSEPPDLLNKRKRERDENECFEDGRAIQRRFTKWHKEPLLSRMRAAVIEVRFERESSVDVARRTCIPARTIRRYVAMSKDPSRRESLFYMPKDPRSSLTLKFNRLRKSSLGSNSDQHITCFSDVTTVFSQNTIK